MEPFVIYFQINASSFCTEPSPCLNRQILEGNFRVVFPGVCLLKVYVSFCFTPSRHWAAQRLAGAVYFMVLLLVKKTLCNNSTQFSCKGISLS